MGRIADAACGVTDGGQPPRTNQVDDILSELDDADRAVVLGWLFGNLNPREVSELFEDYDIPCSPDTVRRWRRFQERGRGMAWAA